MIRQWDCYTGCSPGNNFYSTTRRRAYRSEKNRREIPLAVMPVRPVKTAPRFRAGFLSRRESRRGICRRPLPGLYLFFRRVHFVVIVFKFHNSAPGFKIQLFEAIIRQRPGRIPVFQGAEAHRERPLSLNNFFRLEYASFFDPFGERISLNIRSRAPKEISRQENKTPVFFCKLLQGARRPRHAGGETYHSYD